jgi:hypothetical protein
MGKEMKKTAFVEADVNEVRAVWNLITVVTDDSFEETNVQPYATKDQAEDAKDIFLKECLEE